MQFEQNCLPFSLSSDYTLGPKCKGQVEHRINHALTTSGLLSLPAACVVGLPSTRLTKHM